MKIILTDFFNHESFSGLVDNAVCIKHSNHFGEDVRTHCINKGRILINSGHVKQGIEAIYIPQSLLEKTLNITAEDIPNFDPYTKKEYFVTDLRRSTLPIPLSFSYSKLGTLWVVPNNGNSWKKFGINDQIKERIARAEEDGYDQLSSFKPSPSFPK